MKCCNTCEDVREAYRRKGWALTSFEGIVQCDREGIFVFTMYIYVFVRLLLCFFWGVEGAKGV